MSLALITPPPRAPLTIDEVRQHLRIDHDQDDAYLLDLIAAATQHVEGRFGVTERALLTQTWAETFDAFPCQPTLALRLTIAPVASVSSITYLDTAGAEQTWAPADYRVDVKSIRARILPGPQGVYPPTLIGFNGVTVTYIAGYGVTPLSVPAPIRQALLGLVGHFYEHREAVGDPMAPVPMFVEALLSPYGRLAVTW